MNLGNLVSIIEEGQKRKSVPVKLEKFLRWAAVVIVLYHVYSAVFSTPFDLIFRAHHVGIFLCIVFLLYSPWSKGDKGITWWDIVLILLTISCVLYLEFDKQRVMFRWWYSDPVYLRDVIFGSIFVVLVWEASRRTMGMALTIISGVLILYSFIGPIIPGIFGHRGFSISQLIEVLYLTESGLWGTTTSISSTIAFIFVVFGAFLKMTGGGEYFFDVAQKLAGSSRGGIAKTAVIASAFFGSLSGSPIANAASTGSVTIPMMKRSGYPAAFAGAVETAASCGGPIMPPVMGAAAFLMAEILGVSYFKIIAIAAIPAIIYFAGVFIQVDSQAVRLGLRGIDRSLLKPWKTLIPGVVQYFVPLAWLVLRLYQGFTPARCGMETVLLLIFFTAVRRRGKMSLDSFLDAFYDSVKTLIPVVMACAAGGIVIGVITLTGVAAKFTTLILGHGSTMIFASLVLAMLVSLLLGLPLNITPTYILTAALAGPALIKAGLPPMSVHLFLVYYAAMGSLTPPVALTAFTAAGIAGANVMEVSWKGWRLGASAFVIPFAFIYRPGLLYFNDLILSLEAILFTVLAVYSLVCCLDGWLVRYKTNAMNNIARGIFLVLWLCFMIPILYLNLAALVVFVGMFLLSDRKKGTMFKMSGQA